MRLAEQALDKTIGQDKRSEGRPYWHIWMARTVVSGHGWLSEMDGSGVCEMPRASTCPTSLLPSVRVAEVDLDAGIDGDQDARPATLDSETFLVVLPDPLIVQLAWRRASGVGDKTPIDSIRDASFHCSESFLVR